jgi:hypothetical protein
MTSYNLPAHGTDGQIVTIGSIQLICTRGGEPARWSFVIPDRDAPQDKPVDAPMLADILTAVDQMMRANAVPAAPVAVELPTDVRAELDALTARLAAMEQRIAANEQRYVDVTAAVTQVVTHVTDHGQRIAGLERTMGQIGQHALQLQERAA